MTEPSRNSLCPCGSGTKYKHCCMGKPAPSAKTKRLNLLAGGIGLGSIIAGFSGWYYWGWEGAAQISIVGILVGAAVRIFLNPPPATRDRSGSGSINFGK